MCILAPHLFMVVLTEIEHLVCLWNLSIIYRRRRTLKYKKNEASCAHKSGNKVSKVRFYSTWYHPWILWLLWLFHLFLGIWPCVDVKFDFGILLHAVQLYENGIFSPLQCCALYWPADNSEMKQLFQELILSCSSVSENKPLISYIDISNTHTRKT